MYFNTQEEIITKISKCLEKSLILREKVIKILAGIVIGIILARSTIVSKIAENLKEDFCNGKEESKIKKIKRFMNKKISSDPRNKSMEDVKEGLRRVKKLLEPYKYEVTVLADRGFGSTELFEYIEKMGWTYFIRVKGIYTVKIKEDEVIGKLEDIEHPRKFTRFFYGVELTQNKYKCNIASKPSGEKEEDTWHIATNGDPKKAINNYKRRFTIEEMFKDMKSIQYISSRNKMVQKKLF